MSSNAWSARVIIAGILSAFALPAAHAVKVREIRPGSIIEFNTATDVIITKCQDLAGFDYLRCKTGRPGLQPAVEAQPGERAVILQVKPVRIMVPLSRYLGYRITFKMDHCSTSCVRTSYVLENLFSGALQRFTDPWSFEFDFPTATLVPDATK